MSELRPMRVLVACEESQVVCKAFRARGHEAYSCDLQKCSGGHPEWHIIADALTVINGGKFKTQTGTTVFIKRWDMMIAFPPCTYISSAGLHWCKKNPARSAQRDEGLRFLISLYNQPISKIAIENPVGYANTNFRAPNQIIQPFYFGDPHLKTTCLWLKGLKRLNGMVSVGMNPKAHRPEPLSIDSTGKKRYFVDSKLRKSIDRSKTFPGIARAMAEQWSPDLSQK